MKKVKVLYLALGFIAGVAYLISCGGSSSSIADTIGNAIDVVYDNVASGLSATNVQDAIDELAENSGTALSASTLAGTWTGTQYFHGEATENVTVTFGADNSFSCSGGNDDAISALGSGAGGLCSATYTWSIKGNTVLLTNAADANGYRIIKVDSIDSTNIGLLFALEIPSQYDFFYGTKE